MAVLENDSTTSSLLSSPAVSLKACSSNYGLALLNAVQPALTQHSTALTSTIPVGFFKGFSFHLSPYLPFLLVIMGLVVGAPA